MMRPAAAAGQLDLMDDGVDQQVVSDYGKLTAADQHISTDWASRPICTT
jgi:hypothetical protein